MWQLIEVQDTLVGLSVSSNGVIPKPGLPFAYSFKLTQGTNYTCVWDLGGGGPTLTSNDYTSPIGGSSFSTVFVNGGIFQVTVTCSNNISAVNYTFQQICQLPIVNLRLVTLGWPLNQPVKVSFAIDQGSQPNFQLTFDGVSKTVVYSDPLKTGYTNPLLPAQSPGLHTVTVTATNYVNSLSITSPFVIEVPVVNPFVSLSTNVTVAGQPVNFLAGVQNGTSVKVTWVYGDGSANDTYQDPPLHMWPANYMITQTHTWTKKGVFNVLTIIENSYNSYTLSQTIYICGVLDGLYLNSTSPASYTGIDGASAKFFFALTTSRLVTALWVTFDWGDYSPVKKFPFSLSSKYEHTFYSIADFNVKATVSDLEGSLTYTTVLRVLAPITGFDIRWTPAAAPIGWPFNVSVYLITGTNVTFSIDWGDNSGNVTKWLRRGKFIFRQS
jgi:hypothetical protein